MLEEQIQMDPSILAGVVPGTALKYYIKESSGPKSIEMRLIVKVGSLMENDHEQGMAHFIEHLGFKGCCSYAYKSFHECI